MVMIRYYISSLNVIFLLFYADSFLEEGNWLPVCLVYIKIIGHLFTTASLLCSGI